MKRYLSLFLALLLAFSLTACASDPLQRQLMLSQATLSELQEELADRLADEEDAPSSRVPGKQEEPEGQNVPDEEENLAASLKDRLSEGAAAEKDGSTSTGTKGTSGQNDTAQTSKTESEPEEDSEPQSVTVYITKTGKKYHRDGCQYLRKSKIETTLSSAKERGYTACSKCKP